MSTQAYPPVQAPVQPNLYPPQNPVPQNPQQGFVPPQNFQAPQNVPIDNPSGVGEGEEETQDRGLGKKLLVAGAAAVAGHHIHKKHKEHHKHH